MLDLENPIISAGTHNLNISYKTGLADTQMYMAIFTDSRLAFTNMSSEDNNISGEFELEIGDKIKILLWNKNMQPINDGLEINIR